MWWQRWWWRETIEMCWRWWWWRRKTTEMWRWWRGNNINVLAVVVVVVVEVNNRILWPESLYKSATFYLFLGLRSAPEELTWVGSVLSAKNPLVERIVCKGRWWINTAMLVSPHFKQFYCLARLLQYLSYMRSPDPEREKLHQRGLSSVSRLWSNYEENEKED